MTRNTVLTIFTSNFLPAKGPRVIWEDEASKDISSVENEGDGSSAKKPHVGISKGGQLDSDTLWSFFGWNKFWKEKILKRNSEEKIQQIWI